MCQGNWIRSYKSYGRENHGLFLGYFGRFHGVSELEQDFEKRAEPDKSKPEGAGGKADEGARKAS